MSNKTGRRVSQTESQPAADYGDLAERWAIAKANILMDIRDFKEIWADPFKTKLVEYPATKVRDIPFYSNNQLVSTSDESQLQFAKYCVRGLPSPN